MCAARHAQITINNKFAISLQYLKKEVSDEVGFCMQRSMKVSFKLKLWFWWEWSNILKVPRMTGFQCLYSISMNKLEIKLMLCMQINIKVTCKMLSTLWASKIPTKWYYHYWWAWSSILKVPKVKRYQYLYNMSKKKIRMEIIFCM